jgi:molecular chaperone GrpE
MDNAPHERKRHETGNGQQPHREPIAITDRRRIDPVTGQVREHTPASSDAHAEPGGKAPPPGRERGARSEAGKTDADRRPEELTADLQRLHAEYANYRRRVDRDRAAVAENARASVAARFLGVLDDLDRARDHGDTDREPLRSLDRKIRAILDGMGVSAFGKPGDRFDPARHEAAVHEGSGTDPVVGTVLRRGYTFGADKVLQAAVVTVIDRDRYEHDPAASRTREEATEAGEPEADASEPDIEGGDDL